MRGGLERWKRGVRSQGVRQAVDYAFQGSCDSHLHTHSGVESLGRYSDVEAGSVERFAVTDEGVAVDRLDVAQLRAWVDGSDPETGQRRGRELASPNADLVLDGTINAPKSFSLAALLVPELASEFEALQDRLRDRVITTWQRELNARRGAQGREREEIAQLEVVELKHRRSRALDPHIHRHLWLNVKVLGRDGRWSNIDSRVAMRLHTVINGEGEVAARTDPQWVAALARHGFTLNADGEIAQLAAAVRPLSRRSNQIEANRAMKLAEWQKAHPGQEPSHTVLQHIDRWAWAKARPNKPGTVEEESWEQLIRDEIEQIDPTLLRARGQVGAPVRTVADLDRDLLAAMAVVDADNRSSASGGRFSMYDVRGGALRAIAGSGVVAERDTLTELVEDIVVRALDSTVDMTETEPDVPSHIKHLMSVQTAAMKVDLAGRFDALNEPGVPLDRESTAEVAGEVLAGTILDDGQLDAAGAIAGTDRLVAVTGPAGTGKTTMLRVAKTALDRQGRSMVIVAPTKKAATVAGREVGTHASSLHALLVDHGWRFTEDDAGGQVWTQLEVGDADPLTGGVYAGPQRYPLGGGDRIVVDEAGMVDLHTANALAVVAAQTGAGIAMVGDHLQAMPVGHSGAMATMARRSGTVVELTAVHRFKDKSYADLSLRMREPEGPAQARQVAEELQERGHIHRVGGDLEARELMVEGYFTWANRGKRVALVTSTNAEAQAINEEIQQQRIDQGQIAADAIGVGQNEQRLLVGDVVQTRRNNRDSGVENRALWVIAAIADDRIQLASINDSIDVRDVSAEYAADHLHLAYASTVHGIQGETCDASLVGPGVDAAGLYVGMTRGRSSNVALAVAKTDADAVDQIAETMMRGTVEVTLDDARRAAQLELGRAARMPREDRAPARWDDARRRPFGAATDLDQRWAVAEHRVQEARAALEASNETLRTLRTALRELNARIAEREAKNQAARSTGAPETSLAALEVDRERKMERLDVAVNTRTDAAREYARLSTLVDALYAERIERSRQSEAARAADDLARSLSSHSPGASYSRELGGI